LTSQKAIVAIVIIEIIEHNRMIPQHTINWTV